MANHLPVVKKDPSSPNANFPTHVTLCIHEGTAIKIPRSTIIKSSDRLKAMLDSHEGTDSRIMIQPIPNVLMRSADFLNFFGRILQHELHAAVQQWPITNSMQIYAWAHYYQVVYMMEESIQSTIDFYASKINLNPRNLKIYLRFLDSFNLKEIKDAIANRELPITKDNCIEFYAMCKTHHMKSLIDQIVTFMAQNVDPDDKWPSDLLILVLKQIKETNRELCKKNEDLNKKNEILRNKKRKISSDSD